MATLETKSGIEVEDFRKDYLFGLPSQLRKSSEWSSTFLYNKIRAAEDTLERDLSVYYTPKIIMSEPAATLIQGTDYDIAEPAYDYSSDFYVGERWGDIRLRRYPVRSVQSVKFCYPNIDHRIMTVPPVWVRLNGPFGRIRLVPDSASMVLSFTAYMLSIFSGGRGVPQSIFVNYTAGFSGVDGKADLATDYQDFLELTKRLAVLNIVEDAFMPSSTSNSADGLSQSQSYVIKDFRGSYEKSLEKFRNKIKGVRCVFV